MNLKKEWKIWKEISKDYKISLHSLKRENTLYYLKKLLWLKITDKKVLLRAKKGSMRYHV